MGVEINLVCVQKGQRIKVEAKDWLKDKYRYFISGLLCMWSMILVYYGYI